MKKFNKTFNKRRPTGQAHSHRTTDTGYIRWIDGLGRRRSKLAETATPPGPRMAGKNFRRRLMLERIRAERELGIDPKHMHAHARRRWEEEQRREIERRVVEEKTGEASA